MGSEITTLVDFSTVSGWTAAAVATLALVALVGVLCLCRIHQRIARRVHLLEQELQQRRNVETQLETARVEFETRVNRRARALEARNAALMQSRLTLETANQRLQRLVAVDALTGIANRRQFDRSLERELRRARRDGQPLSLIFLDLDEFKRFNDTYGHARGDEVLRKVAQTLNETFRRGGDFVARYGGEEFAVVLPGVDARRGALYAERLRRRIWRLYLPYSAAERTDRVTISGGVATVPAGIVASADELLGAADKALYRAKCLGRNQIASAAVETAGDMTATKAAS
ncbi:MAG TPA: GGDEF domain-containing protein [Povalibacter sp.]|nr:GGDEF domain-containing protein [Povalibacter sp.]